MGLLDKVNHRATRRSVTLWAVSGGVVGGLMGYLLWSHSDMPNTAVLFTVPALAIMCAIAGGTIEWQLPAESDSNPSPNRRDAMSAYDPLNASTDTFRPPEVSILVHCIHCGQEYDSYRIEWRIKTSRDGRPHGFWCCPIHNCDGMGFGFDIYPVDPEYRDENGDKMWCTDDEDGNTPDAGDY